ncbi:uncharacterized protein LOC143242294 [Tachypleus tridentatus]|uniref:uncharacterized protein LOC143242294 n=1 Tax=Tachypleus tridentatus TaxID=6853 RepID=UPI003FD17645
MVFYVSNDCFNDVSSKNNLKNADEFLVKELSKSCVSDRECEVNDMHSLCKNGACACRDNFTLFQNVNVSSCISDDRLDTRGISDEEWSTSEGIETRTMIPIIVVLGIMFIGMCVALQLFSRARFRNQRTIFNSPHPRLMHIKLGKKRKSNSKRSSHLSLHVPVSRRPSASNYSQRSHPSLVQMSVLF